jgi:hypothetical protein
MGWLAPCESEFVFSVMCLIVGPQDVVSSGKGVWMEERVTY